MAISSYSSYEKSEMDKQEKSVLKSNCKKIRSVTTDSSVSIKEYFCFFLIK